VAKLVDIAALALSIIAVGCGGLPSDFDQLGLKEKISAYQEHLSRYGRPLPHAQSEISWHGWKAAELMSESLCRKRTALPKYEAIAIIEKVQLRGCSLRGTVAERCMETLLQGGTLDALERSAAQRALDSIRRNVVIPDGIDTARRGPCAQAPR
jgi:hypothetical protein